MPINVVSKRLPIIFNNLVLPETPVFRLPHPDRNHHMWSAVFENLKFSPEPSPLILSWILSDRGGLSAVPQQMLPFHFPSRSDLPFGGWKTVCLLLWGTVAGERPPLTLSARKNKQIEQVNKWTWASLPLFLPPPTSQSRSPESQHLHADDGHDGASEVFNRPPPPRCWDSTSKCLSRQFFKSVSRPRRGGEGWGKREIPQPKKNIQVQRRSEEKDGGREIMSLWTQAVIDGP